MTNICSDSRDVLDSFATKYEQPRSCKLGAMTQRSSIPLSSTIISSDLNSVKKSDPKPDLCLFCRDPLDAFGTCRLYSGWQFVLLRCSSCGRYYSKPPAKLGGPFLYQAFTFAQIVAEVEMILADEVTTRQPASSPSKEKDGR